MTSGTPSSTTVAAGQGLPMIGKLLEGPDDGALRPRCG